MRKFWRSGSAKTTEPVQTQGCDRNAVRRHIVFCGQAQGVGFRYYSVQKAQALGLTGWVRNRSDGTVEMEVQGRENEIDTLICFLQSRQWIEIEHMDMKNIPVIPEQNFRERW